MMAEMCRPVRLHCRVGRRVIVDRQIVCTSWIVARAIQSENHQIWYNLQGLKDIQMSYWLEKLRLRCIHSLLSEYVRFRDHVDLATLSEYKPGYRYQQQQQ